jgi:hypothetical protein
MCESGGEDVSQVYERVYGSNLMNINFNQNFPIFWSIIINIYNKLLDREWKERKKERTNKTFYLKINLTRL